MSSKQGLGREMYGSIVADCSFEEQMLVRSYGKIMAPTDDADGPASHLALEVVDPRQELLSHLANSAQPFAKVMSALICQPCRRWHLRTGHGCRSSAA